jgi:predicted outer membrane protein
VDLHPLDPKPQGMNVEDAMRKLPFVAACTLAAALALMPDGASAQVADSAKKDTVTARPPAPAQNQPEAARPTPARQGGAISDSAIIAMLQLEHTQQIASAELATQRAQSDRVKRFAETLKAEHGTALQELQAYAQRMQGAASGMPSGMVRDSARPGVVAPNPAQPKPDSSAMIPDSARVGRDNNANVGRPDTAAAGQKPGGQPDVSFDNLQALSGHEFDHGFVRLQVQHHQAEINRLRNDVIPMIKDSGLKALVQRELPAMGKHLRDAQELEAYLKTTK